MGTTLGENKANGFMGNLGIDSNPAFDNVDMIGKHRAWKTR